MKQSKKRKNKQRLQARVGLNLCPLDPEARLSGLLTTRPRNLVTDFFKILRNHYFKLEHALNKTLQFFNILEAKSPYLKGFTHTH